VLLLGPEGATAVQRIASASGWQVSVQGCQVQIDRARTRTGTGGPVLPPEVTPPTPAVVVAVHVKAGDRVKRGQPVVVVSAMKLQTALVSPRDGVVTAVRVKEGDQVRPGQVLVSIEDRPHGGTP
jgi:biotin carboxyl carrier protein